MNDTRPIALVRWLDAERQNDPFLADLIEPAITSVMGDLNLNQGKSSWHTAEQDQVPVAKPER